MAIPYRFYTSYTGIIILLLVTLTLCIGAGLIYGYTNYNWKSNGILYSGIILTISSVIFIVRYLYVIFNNYNPGHTEYQLKYVSNTSDINNKFAGVNI